MNPETTLVWHPLQSQLIGLRKNALAAGVQPPHWDRVENAAGAGTPDLSWAWAACGLDGHLELKYRELPPVRDTTPVVIETITPHQRLWWRQRSQAGGNIKVLLRLGITWLMYEGDQAARGLGQWTFDETMDRALYRSDKLDALQLMEACA